jgi:hypothetical protein
MTTELKKQAEERYVKLFLDGRGIEYTAIEAGEKPDFRVKLKAAPDITIEVTEYHPKAEGVEGMRRVAVEARWSKELEQVLDQERRTRACLQDIQLHLGFNGRTPPSKRVHAVLAEELVRLVEDVSARLTYPGQEIEVEFAPRDTIAARGSQLENTLFLATENWPEASKDVSLLHVSRWPGVTWPNWVCQDIATAWLGPEVEELRRVLEEKRDKAQHYDLGGAPLWLLIVCAVQGDLQSHIFPRNDDDMAQLVAVIGQTGFRFEDGPFAEVGLLSAFGEGQLRVHPLPA